MNQQHQGSYNTFPAQSQAGYAFPNNPYNINNHFPGPNPGLGNTSSNLAGQTSQTTAYSYPPAVQPSFQQPVQQSQFFPALPQGGSPNPPPRQKQKPRTSTAAQNAHTSISGTSANGPRAPPPERESPELDEDLVNVLHRDNANDEDDDQDDEEEDPNDAVYHLPAPPNNTYANPDELDKAIHAWSLEHGYELVRRASKKNARGVLYKRFYHCSKHGRIGNKRGVDKEKTRVRRKSNRMGCPMNLAAVSCDPSDPSGSWQIKVRKAHHNHPAEEGVKMAGHRRRARMGGIEDAVDGLLAIDTKIPDVLKFLQRTHPDGLFTRTDVANMKLKYKKYGTCANRDGTGERIPIAVSNHKRGVPFACHSCRQKRTKCDSKRPTCTTCLRQNMPCTYDYEASPPPDDGAEPQTQNPATHGNAVNQKTPAMPSPSFPYHHTTASANPPSVPAAAAQTTTENLELRALLARFQAEHIKPVRLTLDSAEVEYLATSTCGNGSSYVSVPSDFAAKDWAAYQIYCDAFVEAARKENTYDVLVGTKRRPAEPWAEPVTGHPGEFHEVDIKLWNEYIKQLAIYLRRNDSLLGAILSTLSPNLRARLRNMTSARELWIALEDTCRPRGSEQAFYRYIELHTITLANSGSLDEYIFRLQDKADNLNYLNNDSFSSEQQRRSTAERPGARPASTNGAISDSALCFQFLMGLGDEHRRLVDSLCKKNNIGGFGSGETLKFKEVARLVRQLIDT